MLRASALLILAAILLAASLGLSWGNKTVAHETCALDDRAQPLCHATIIEAFYDPTALRGRLAYLEGPPGALEPVGDDPFWHPYGSGPDGAATWWHSRLLETARPLLLAAAVFAPVTVAAAWALRDKDPWRRALPWLPLATAGLVLAALAASLGGVLLHATAWTGTRVFPLYHMPGTWVLLSAGLVGLTGGLRLHTVLRDRLLGLRQTSPLVPALRLFRFETEDEAAPDPTPEQIPLRQRWPTGATLMALGMVLLLLPLGLPLAHKEITLRTCEDTPERGGVCHEETLQVAYHAGFATVRPDAPPDAATPAGRFYTYFGAFQDAHGGPAWMGLGIVLVALGALATVAWTTGGILPRPILSSPGPVSAPTLRWVAMALLAVGTLASLAAVAWQAGTWLGAPARPSRPGPGLWSALLGLLALGRSARQCLHAPAPCEATARATSGPD